MGSFDGSISKRPLDRLRSGKDDAALAAKALCDLAEGELIDGWSGIEASLSLVESVYSRVKREPGIAVLISRDAMTNLLPFIPS